MITCWGIIHTKTGRMWSSDNNRQYWGTAVGARRAFDKYQSLSLADNNEYEMIEMADIRANAYRIVLEQWLTLTETTPDDDLVAGQLQLYKETRYVLGLDPRPVAI